MILLRHQYLKPEPEHSNHFHRKTINHIECTTLKHTKSVEMSHVSASPVAGVAEHLSVMLSDAARVQELAAQGAGEAELVVHLAQRLHLLREIHILVTPGTHSGHSGEYESDSEKGKKNQIQGINQQFHKTIKLPIDFHD